MRRKSRDLRMI